MTDSVSDKKHKSFRNYIWNILGVFIVALLGWYLYQNRDILNYLGNISWKQVLWIVLLDLASFLINGLLDYSMINRLGGRVSFLDCYLLGYANNFLNKILPTIGGGAAFRAAFLKKKYQFPYSRFVSTIGGLYVISFFSTSLIGVACLGLIYARYGVFNWLIFLVFAGIGLFCFSVMLFSPRIPETGSRILKILNSIFDGWKIIKREPRYIVIYAFFSILLVILSTLQTWISYRSLGVETDFTAMLFLATLGIIQAFLNFTPDGLGVKEGLFVFSADLVQIPGDILVLGSLVLRGISFCTTFVIGGIFYLSFARRFSAENME